MASSGGGGTTGGAAVVATNGASWMQAGRSIAIRSGRTQKWCLSDWQVRMFCDAANAPANGEGKWEEFIIEEVKEGNKLAIKGVFDQYWGNGHNQREKVFVVVDRINDNNGAEGEFYFKLDESGDNYCQDDGWQVICNWDAAPAGSAAAFTIRDLGPTTQWTPAPTAA